MLCSMLIPVVLLPTRSLATPFNLIFGLKGQVVDFLPQAIVDVGANKGKYSSFIHRMYPDAAILMIEADSKHEEKLKKFASDKPNVEYNIALLSSEENEEVNWFGGGDTGNSMFRERSKFYENDTPVTKTTATLDNIVTSSHVSSLSVDIIKVDVQGAELMVLQGARQALSKATFVQFEGSTVAYNEGGSCTWQVDAFLRSQGYALYDLGERTFNPEIFKTPGTGQYDLIYINTKRLPRGVQNATFCAGTDNDPKSSVSLFEESMVELEQIVGIDAPSKAISNGDDNNQNDGNRCKRRGSGGILLLIGVVIGYFLCFLKMQFFSRRRRLQRED